MRGHIVRAWTGAVALAAGAAVLPLAAPGSAAADSVVIGGSPVQVSDHPWVVAIASRDRFGGTRSGQFCGGAVVNRTTVLTAAHCVSADVLGAPLSEVKDLKVIAGRNDLRTSEGNEVTVSSVRTNPEYNSSTNSGDAAALTLKDPLPESYVIPRVSIQPGRKRSRSWLFLENFFREVVRCRLAANVPYCVSYESYGFALSVRSGPPGWLAGCS
ncbi:hypothetical protein SALBM135S_08101 [Streptomyces alboniger]